ncbi:MAG: helix-turn-helix transcriptional regulator [Rhodococcus sp. (in: high G+C Gram-positive bacteria)]|uniref:helix-turn-helix domain-containing protein n=1 Tax=Rhodococcus sp. TaxID=1831 RepID=UPI003BB59EF3
MGTGLYRKIELTGDRGFGAMTSDAGNRTELSVPDATRFRFVMEACEVGPLIVSRVSMTPHRALAGPVEDGELVNLCLLLAGEQRIDSGTARTTVSVGQIAVQVGWNRHESLDPGGSDLVLLRLDRRRLEERGVRFGTDDVTFGPSRPSLSTHALTALAVTVLREQARRNAAAPNRGVENALVELIVGLHHESLGRRADSLEFAGSVHARAMAVLDSHFADSSLTPAKLAEQVQVPLRTLQRAFAAHGTTIAARLRTMRVRHATMLLSDQECRHLTVTEIAGASGFASSAELRRAVRAERGVTPGELRPRPSRNRPAW